jgi:serine/threonine protein kinase
MKKLDHPNIIKLYEIIDDPNSEKLYLIMPVADYGESIEWDPSYTPPSFAALGASGSFNGGRPLNAKEQIKNEGSFHFHPNHRL